MSTTNIEHEIADLERRYWIAIKENDIETVLSLTDDPCIIVGSQGVARLDHRALGAMMGDARWKVDSFELGDDLQVRMLGTETAITAYQVREQLTVEGKPVSLTAFDSSTWVRRNGRWVCALHTESPAGDPFGRDRR